MAALCITGYLAGRRLWSIAAHARSQPNWIFPFNSYLPNWAALVLNLVIYGAFALFLVEVLRHFRGTEGTLLAVLISETLLAALRNLVPVPAATAILWVQSFGNLVMFFAAIHIFLSIPARKEMQPEE